MRGQVKLLSAALLSAVVLTGCVSTPKTTVSGTIGDKPFSIVSPKDSELVGLQIASDTNKTLVVRIERLTTKMNPEVITTSAAGQAAIISATAAAVQQATASALAAAAASAAK